MIIFMSYFDENPISKQYSARLDAVSSRAIPLRNMSMQYTAIFHGCKNVNFQMIFF